MLLDKNQLELFLAFIARHHRFLKLRETSYNAKQIADGISVVEKAVKAVLASCKSSGQKPAECLETPAKKNKLVRLLRGKVPRLGPKQALFVVEKFEAFHAAVMQEQDPQAFHSKTAKKNAEYGDRYYQPVEHKYR